MLIDGFIFYNELGLLKYRLELLYPIVDKFILVESTKTFSGNSKELFYEKNKELYEKYADKIIHIIVDDTPETTSAWDREAHQRRSISRGFENISLENKDIILISDVDEIPNPDLLNKIKEVGLQSIYSLKQDLYYYNLNTFLNLIWIRPKIFPFSFFKQNPDVDKIRYMDCKILNNGGWHLSFFGTPAFISNKIKNFSHQEYNLEKYTNEERVQECLSNTVDVFGRNIHFIKIPIDQNKNLPPNHTLLLDYLT
jgi:beta-1,4-mannosyl-glycoprotein beta-1,4-N-acetylglucosaminyltransferase